jgi:parallel beta-helix repeat protein
VKDVTNLEDMNRSSSNSNPCIHLNYRRLFSLSLLLGILLSLFFLRIPHARAATEVGGSITVDTTWSADNSPYIVVSESVTVTQGVQLTIEPGVSIRFNPGLKLWVDGVLIARGTDSNPITFTSNNPTPAPGNWGNIHFLTTAEPTVIDEHGNYISGSILQYCVIEYAGFDGVSYQNAVYSFLNTLMVDNCLIENNTGSGIMIVSDNDTLSWVTNNALNNNHAWGHGGGVLLYYGVIKNNIVSNNHADGGTDGGGIFALQADVIDNIVTNNRTKETSGTEGAGIYLVSEGSGSLLVQGNIVQGNSAVNTGGGIYIFSNSATQVLVRQNIISGNSADDSGGGIYLRGSKGTVTIQENMIYDNIADADADQTGSGGGIFCDYRAGTHNIQDNIIYGNSAGNRGGGIYTNGCHISGNQIINNTAVFAGGGVVTSGDVISNTISANSLSGETASGAGVYLQGSGDFLYNSITNNTAISNTMTGGLHINGTPAVHFNNLYGNLPYDVVVQSSETISGTENYWNTDDEADIPDLIYDKVDDPARGEFIYSPILTEPPVEVPLLPPTGFTATLVENHIELEWDPDPNFSTDWGYKVYYDTDSMWAPYDGTGLDEGDSPIDVGDLTSFTLNGIEANTDYYLAVTVYDDKGRESDYAIAAVYQEWVPLPSTPTGLTATLIGDTIDLKWDADPFFTQGWGYLVYYDTDSLWAPFEGTGLDEGDSPIDVGDQTTYTLTGVVPYIDYYLAVTVYDNFGNESNYAVTVVNQDDPPTPPPIIYLPLVSR